MPVVIFFACLDIGQKSSFLDGHLLRLDCSSGCKLKTNNTNLTRRKVYFYGSSPNYSSRGQPPSLKLRRARAAFAKASGYASGYDPTRRCAKRTRGWREML
jgi:hypothetical protein